MKRIVQAGIAILVLFAAAIGVCVWYAASGRLAADVRSRIVAQIERSTGGHAEIGAFHFDWQTLTARIDRLVIHGAEPPTAAPLFSAKRIVVRLRIVSFLERRVDLVSVDMGAPRADLIIAANGGTNLPSAKSTGVSNLLDLRVGQFDARDGVLITQVNGESASQPWNAHGRNLVARLNYDETGRKYRGSISVAPMRISARDLGSVELNANTEIEIGRDRLRISNADLTTAQSELRLSNLIVRNFAAPSIESHYEGRVALAEFTKQRGEIESSGDFRFSSPASYSVTGMAHAENIGLGPFQNARVTAKIEAVPDRIVLSDVRAHIPDGDILGGAEISKLRDFRVNGKIERFAASRVIDIVLREKIPYDAWLAGPFEASGRLNELRAGRITVSAHLAATPDNCAGCIPIHGELQAKYDGNSRTLELGQSSISLPSTNLAVSGVPGRELNVKIETRDLADFRPALGRTNYVALEHGAASFAGDIAGPLESPSIAGHLTFTNVLINRQKVDSFSGDMAARSSDFSVKNGALAEGALKARVAGSVALENWHPIDRSAVDANVQVSGADLKTLLGMAGAKDIALTGSGSADAHVTGTIAEPRFDATAALARGTVYGQPYDALTARLQYRNSGAQLFNVTFISGAKRITANGSFTHATGAAPLTGTLDFRAQSNPMALNQIALVRERQPDLHGIARFHGEGSAHILRDAKNNLTVELQRLDGDASASGIELEGRNLGDARLTAATSGHVVNVRLDSNAAKASIHGEGTVELSAGYPANASITFSRAGLNALATLIAKPEQARRINFDGTAAGEMTLRGPLGDWRKVSGSASVPEIEIYPVTAPDACGSENTCAGIKSFRLRNDGPVRLAFANGTVSIESAHFAGPQTDVSVTGTMGFTARSGYNLRATGDVNLALASTFSTDYATGGTMHVNAALRGAIDTPDLSGTIQIRNGSARYAGFANGVNGVNAALAFNGNRATIQNFTGESGGGHVEVGGFVALTGGLIAFRLDTRTTGVRLRFAEGVSIVSDSHITLAGTSERSEASGTVVVHRVTINPRADFSNVFARSAEPVKAPAVQAGMLSKLNLDVQIETAPDVALETSVAQRIDADANLRLRGTATNPALLGRINITSGDLMFFGNKYTITTGSISFLNPSRIDPILNVDLETKARGVDVILTIAGPIAKPGVSYRSDPPLQFSDIVALLATGRSPYDPGLPGGTVGQQQAFAQLGASQLIGEALQNPASGRLQRFFGVSKVKIDPQLTDVTGSPESRLTIEQQVSPDILFTYITDVSSTSTQLIRVEWAFNRNWSAIVTREENGYVGLDFSYRKRFK